MGVWFGIHNPPLPPLELLFCTWGAGFYLQFNATTLMTEITYVFHCLSFRTWWRSTPHVNTYAPAAVLQKTRPAPQGSTPHVQGDLPPGCVTWLTTPKPLSPYKSHTPPSSAVNGNPIISPMLQQTLSQCITQVTSAFLDQQQQLMVTFAQNILSTKVHLDNFRLTC